MWMSEVLILGLLHFLLHKARRTSAQVDCTHSGVFTNAEAGPTTITYESAVTVNCAAGWVNVGASTVTDNSFILTCSTDGNIISNPASEMACMKNIDECAPDPADATNDCTETENCTNDADGEYDCEEILCYPTQYMNVFQPVTSLSHADSIVRPCERFFWHPGSPPGMVIVYCNVTNKVADVFITPQPHCNECFYPGIGNSDQNQIIFGKEGEPATVNCDDGWKNPDDSTMTVMTCSATTGWDIKPDEFTCAIDVDECADNLHNCTAPEICFNTDGSFECGMAVSGEPGDYANAHHPPVTAMSDTEVTMTCLDGWYVAGGNTSDVSFKVAWTPNGTWIPEAEEGCTGNINECDPVGTVCTNPGEKCKDSPGSYSCDCEDGYFWNDLAGICEARECAAITAPDYSTMVTVNAPLTVGVEAMYECDVGFQASHSHPDPANLRQFTVNCMDDGKVCGCSLPTCKLVDCGDPRNDPNSYHTTTAAVTTTYGSTLMYTCNQGYATPTDTTYTKMCDENGNWVQDPDGEFCTDSNTNICGVILSHGKKNYYRNCKGYTIESKGKWKGNVCSKNVNECETMCDRPGEVCIDTIGSYYCLCLRGWQWNSQPLPSGMCVAQTCPILPTLAEATVDAAVTAPIDYGAGVKYTCTPGYKPSQDADPADRTSFTVTCQDGGLFSGSGLPSCIPVDCGVPNNDPKSSYVGSPTTYQSQVMYSCYPGFHWMSPAGTYETTYTRRCLETGLWSDVTNMCEDIDECAPGAKDPKCTENGALCINLPGSYLCQCASGYMFNGTYCLPDECDPPPTELENTEPVVIDGMIASYTCNPGYVTCCGEEEQVKLTCAGRRWWPNSKGCQKRSCGDPGLAAHANRTSELFLYEDKVTYTCQSGFHVNGDETEREFTRKCQANGTWSGLDLYCADINECLDTAACGEETGVLHTCTNTEGSYKCECGGGYVLSGQHTCKGLTQVAIDGVEMVVTSCGLYELLNLCGEGQCVYTSTPEKQPICKCPSNHKGRWCEEKPINWPLILSILSLAFLLLLSFIFMCCCFILPPHIPKSLLPNLGYQSPNPKIPARNRMILPPRRRFFPRNWW